LGLQWVTIVEGEFSQLQMSLSLSCSLSVSLGVAANRRETERTPVEDKGWNDKERMGGRDNWCRN
jgi:hypothetical protein